MNDDRPEWQQRAACRGMGTDIFYSQAPNKSAEARAICAGCEVSAECLTYADSNAEYYGVWAGMGLKQRRKVSTRRRGVRTNVAVCGTEGGYNAHLKRNEEPCRHCRWANAEGSRVRGADFRWRQEHGDEAVAS